jgi:hypothetical protein
MRNNSDALDCDMIIFVGRYDQPLMNLNRETPQEPY